eukprot:1024241-Prymnesium_polylepis.1
MTLTEQWPSLVSLQALLLPPPPPPSLFPFQADDYIDELLQRVKPEYIQRTYGIAAWTSHVDFLEQYATKIGKLA